MTTATFYLKIEEVIKNKFAQLLIFGFLLLVSNDLISQDKFLMKDGIKLSLKSKSTVGKNAMIATYCQDLKKTSSCNEIIITGDGKKYWIPLTTGPVYNLLKNGKTPNYNGMTVLNSKNPKFKQYYTVKDNLIIVVTPKSLSHVISIFRYGSRPLRIDDVKPIFRDDYDPVKDECKCVAIWQDCYAFWSLQNPSPYQWITIQEICDEEFDDCKKDCQNIVFENIQTFLVLRQSIAANDFQIGLRK